VSCVTETESDFRFQVQSLSQGKGFLWLRWVFYPTDLERKEEKKKESLGKIHILQAQKLGLFSPRLSLSLSQAFSLYFFSARSLSLSCTDTKAQATVTITHRDKAQATVTITHRDSDHSWPLKCQSASVLQYVAVCSSFISRKRKSYRECHITLQYVTVAVYYSLLRLDLLQAQMQRDNVGYCKTKRKIKSDLQCSDALQHLFFGLLTKIFLLKRVLLEKSPGKETCLTTSDVQVSRDLSWLDVSTFVFSLWSESQMHVNMHLSWAGELRQPSWKCDQTSLSRPTRVCK